MNRFGRVLWRGLWVTLLIVSALGRAPAPAHAAAFTAFDAASLIAAIDAANANGEPDVITLTDNVTLDAVDNNTAGPNGLPIINSPILIDGSGYTLRAAAPYFRIFYVEGSGDLTLVNLTVSGGYAMEGIPDGSGLYNAGGRVVITGCIFSGNTAIWDGGAIYNEGSLTVTNSTFSGNAAYGFGGGIFNDGTTTVTNSTFSGNTADFGGGIYNGNGTLTVANSTFSGNTADFGGGGISNQGTLTVTNSTFSGNTADFGGGIYNGNGTLTVTNSILASNTAAGSGNNCGYYLGTFTGSDNLEYNPTGTCSGVTQTDDPLLSPLADNGGPTQTMALGAGSPAIDNADAGACPASDQRYYSRVGTCDIGAYEYGGVIIFSAPGVTKAFDPASIPAGGASTLIITLTNGSATDLTGAYFVDVLPAAITVTGSGSTTCGAGSVVAGGSTILATALTIPASASCTVTVLVTSVTVGTHTNTLDEIFTAETGVTTLSGVSADLTVEAVVAPGVGTVSDPALSKIGTLAPGQLGLSGEQITWTITATAPSDANLTNVVVSDTFRSELQIDSVTTTAGAYAINGQTVTVTIPFLSAGSSVTIQVTTTVFRSPEGGTFTNTVTLSADGGVSLSAEGTVLGVSNLPSTGYPPGE